MTDLLEIDSLCKKFPGVQALNQVSFKLQKGKIYGLVGENGAGKSTLVKILMGLYQPSAGNIYLKGEKVKIKDPTYARENLYIDTVFQEHCLIPQMSIAENIFLNQLDKYYENGIINHDKLKSDAEKVLEKVKLNLNVLEKAEEISEGEKSLIEFAKSLKLNPDILIFDEMTAPLESNVVHEVFAIMNDLKKAGKTLIFISHRLEEILEICDEIIVLKDGKFEGIIHNDKNKDAELIRNDIIKKMTGKESGLSFPEKNKKIDEEIILSVKGLKNDCIRNIDIKVYKGEILAIAGLRGQGQRELLRSITGLYPKREGTVQLAKEKLHINTPKDAIKKGLFYISDQRDLEELWLAHEIWFNITLPSLKNRCKFCFIDKKENNKCVDKLISQLNIETPSAAQLVRNLSGGNRQKVVLGKYLLAQPKMLIIDQPTLGLDVGAKIEIYEILRKLAGEGIPTLAVLTDLEEIVNLPDRVLVMREGEIVNEFTGKINEEELLNSYYV